MNNVSTPPKRWMMSVESSALNPIGKVSNKFMKKQSVFLGFIEMICYICTDIKQVTMDIYKKREIRPAKLIDGYLTLINNISFYYCEKMLTGGGKALYFKKNKRAGA